MACYRRYLTNEDIDVCVLVSSGLVSSMPCQIIRRRNEPCDCKSGLPRKKCCAKFIKVSLNLEWLSRLSRFACVLFYPQQRAHWVGGRVRLGSQDRLVLHVRHFTALSQMPLRL